MRKLFKRASNKAGLPPGTLVHIGEKRTEKVKTTVIDYDETHFQEKEVETIEECFPFKDTPTVTWINNRRHPRVGDYRKNREPF